jgi:phosphoribosylglycinamide formyltransferase
VQQSAAQHPTAVPALLLLLLLLLQLIPAELVSAYKRAMLNIHPGLLPSFGGKGLYGERVHAAVIKSGAR